MFAINCQKWCIRLALDCVALCMIERDICTFVKVLLYTSRNKKKNYREKVISFSSETLADTVPF